MKNKEDEYKCKHCNEVFRLKKFYIRHLNTHLETYWDEWTKAGAKYDAIEDELIEMGVIV